MTRTPEPMTMASTHDLVVRVIESDLAGRSAGAQVLDAPCGMGALGVRLAALGCQMTYADIDRGNFAVDAGHWVHVDLNRALPFPDASFDAVVSVAGLQRLYFQEVAIREFHRVLKPGGRLYLALSNKATVRQRLTFLWYGAFGEWVDGGADYHQTLDDPEARFRFPLTYTRAHRLLHNQGFVQEALHLNRWRRLRHLLPVSAMISTVSAVGLWWRRHNPVRFNREANTVAMLQAKAYVIVARK